MKDNAYGINGNIQDIKYSYENGDWADQLASILAFETWPFC